MSYFSLTTGKGRKMNSKVSLTRRDLLSAGVNLSAGSLLAHSAVGRALTTKGVEQGADPAEVPTIRFDVRGAGLKPEVNSTLAKWGGKGAGGHLTANTCHLERDGHPFGIVAGELHLQRVPVEEWEDAILQMKAAGLNTVSCYIFWSPIERQRGHFDFSGRNNIRRFVELCRMHGLFMILRIGPFSNAEFLLGGLPPWLYGLPTTERSNDALYLRLVGLYYAALGGQLRDMLWENGGPIAIIQLENELSVAPVEWNRPFLYAASVTGHMGPTGKAFTEHYRRLHELAISGGLRAPFYSVTGWGANDPYPIEVVMPTFGGYMDLSPAGSQNSSLTLFNFESRAYDGKVPIGFIEIGYGSPARESFRPRPLAISGYASTMTLFGASRSLMVGYYMFRGGSNPVNGDTGWTIKNAIYPLISYDYWAPISEFGEWRPAVFRARPFNLFIQNYSAQLARTEPRAPAQPVSQADDDRPRAEARITEGSGFVFFCNYGNVHPLSERQRFSIDVETEKGVVRIPRATDLTLPPGAVGVWPLYLDLGAGVTLISATAQPVCRFTHGGIPWHIFSQIASLPAEFVFATPATVDAGPHGRRDAAGADTIVARLEPARDSVLEARGADGRKVRLLLLSESDAGRLAQLGTPTSPLLALSDAIVTRSGNTLGVVTRHLADLAVSLFPAQALPASVSGYKVTNDKDGIFQRVLFTGPSREVAAVESKLSADRSVVKLPSTAFDELDDIFMEVDFVGDVCRIFDANTGLLVADFMNNGIPWQVGMKRFRKALADEGLLIRIEPDLVGGETIQTVGTMTLKADQRMRGAKPLLSSVTFHPRYAVRFSLASARRDRMRKEG